MNKNNIKLIVIDLDHTLTGCFNRISSENYQTILKAQKLGIKVVIATGRDLSKAINIAKKLEIDQYSNYLITLNGALNYQIAPKKIISSAPIHPDDLKQTLKIDPNHLMGKVFIDEHNQFFCLNATWLIKLAGIVTKTKITTIDLETLKTKKIVGGFWLGNLNKIKKTQIFKNKIGKVFFASGFPFTSQFSCVNKKDAVFEYAKKFNIKPEEIMAIGDSMNDFELIKAVGFGIAMDNAKPEIKEVAFMTTLSWKKHGVAKAIKRLIF